METKRVRYSDPPKIKNKKQRIEKTHKKTIFEEWNREWMNGQVFLEFFYRHLSKPSSSVRVHARCVSENADFTSQEKQAFLELFQSNMLTEGVLKEKKLASDFYLVEKKFVDTITIEFNIDNNDTKTVVEKLTQMGFEKSDYAFVFSNDNQDEEEEEDEEEEAGNIQQQQIDDTTESPTKELSLHFFQTDANASFEQNSAREITRQCIMFQFDTFAKTGNAPTDVMFLEYLTPKYAVHYFTTPLISMGQLSNVALMRAAATSCLRIAAEPPNVDELRHVLCSGCFTTKHALAKYELMEKGKKLKDMYFGKQCAIKVGLLTSFWEKIQLICDEIYTRPEWGKVVEYCRQLQSVMEAIQSKILNQFKE